MKPLTYMQRYALENLFTGGPDLAKRYPQSTLSRLRREGLIEYCSLNTLLGIKLTDEGNYYMGATP